jgi:hypothetical protein
MDQSTLRTFTSHLDRFETLATYIDKALALADQFRPEIVERVVNGHKASIQELALDLMPAVIELEVLLEQEHNAIEGLETKASETKAALEECELRKLIGALDDEAYELETEPIQAAIDAIDETRVPHDVAILDLRLQLERWEKLGQHTGLLHGEDSAE